MNRIIEPGMIAAQRFKSGDRVAHIRLGDGVVVHSNEVDEVRVRFQKCTGVYDSRWFEMHPGWLFHRGTAPLT